MSYTTSYTFTRSNAEYVASKIAADLKYMQIFFGGPSDEWIEMYRTELIELLPGGYVKNVTYGFKRDGNWVVALRYEARLDGTLRSDDRAGELIDMIGTDVSGLSATSYLVRDEKWFALSNAERTAIEGRIGFSRVGMPEPGTGMGYWVSERSYSANGSGVQRARLKG